MFRKLVSTQIFRNFSTTQAENTVKVTVCGAAGQVGRIISFFLKQSQYNMNISLYDVSQNLNALTKQLSLVNVNNTVEEHIGPLKLRAALKDANIVVIALKTLGKSADEFHLHFSPINNIVKSCMDMCPQAILAIATSPLNLLVPAVNAIYQHHGIGNSHKVLGVTSTDAMSAGVVYSDMFSYESSDVFIPITGGTSPESIVPVFSQATPAHPQELLTTESELLQGKFLEHKYQSKVSELAAGFAITRFIESIIRAVHGEKDVVEVAFVAAPRDAPAKYMTSLIDLDQHGVETVYGPPADLNRYEKKIFYPALMNLQRDISQAERFMNALRRSEARARSSLQ